MSYRTLTTFWVALFVSLTCFSGKGVWAQPGDQASSLRDDFKFDVVSIKLNRHPPDGPWGSGNVSLPDGIHIVGDSTYRTLMLAYLPEGFENERKVSIINAPEWVMSEKYDMDARVAEKDLKAWGGQTGAPYEHVYLRAAMRSLLRERYKLQAHLVDTQIPYLSIAVNKDHDKLVAVSEMTSAPQNAYRSPSGGRMTLTRGEDDNMTWTFFGCTMDDLAFFISQNFHQLAQDKSGLRGRYNFQFTLNRRDFAEDQLSWMEKLAQLGIHLRNDKGPGSSLVIDHIERPEPN
ncbi:MAG TPA: TIGR03435 family protein [Acidobacteriaceae bacterium]|nr:TIGR03435 family protein [Acidobacteriaceae bacterium]